MRIIGKLIFKVCALMCFLPATAGEGNDKLGVAIGDLTWAVPPNNFIKNSSQAGPMINALRAMMTTTLHRTGEFRVIERDQLGQVLKEMEFMHDSGMVDPEKTVEWGRQSGVDYFIIGTVSQFSQVRTSRGVGNLFGKQKNELLMVVDLRMVSTETGELLATEQINTRYILSEGFKASGLLDMLGDTGGDIGKGAQFLDKHNAEGFGANHGLGNQLDGLLRDTATEIIRRIVGHLRPIRVVGISGKRIYLNYGKGLLKEGLVLEVYRPEGEGFVMDGKVYEPGLTHVGQIIITNVQEEISQATPVGDLDPSIFAKRDECKVVEKVEEPKRRKKGIFNNLFKKKKK